MQLFLRISFACCLTSCSFFTPLLAQCITDNCGDIFADWALLSEEITVCEGATFEVANQTIMPDIDFYVWDWGNGERDTVYEVSNHFYTYTIDEGTACSTTNDFIVYNISLEIYRFCEEGQSCHTQIAPVAIRLQPRASFSIPPVICAGETLAITDESCNGDEYLWVFGDGTTSTDPNPDHVFDSTGVYDVTLYLSNSCGTDSISTSIEVFDSPVAASVANGNPTITTGCAPLTVTFNNESENANEYTWNFPSNAGVVFIAPFNQHSPSPTVEFNTPGIHTVTLHASNECGESQWETTVEVLEPPVINLQSLPASCGPTTLSLGDLLESSGSINNIQWTVSGPEVIDIPSILNPVVTFSQPGNYELSVSASNGYCEPVNATTSLQVQEAGVLVLELPTLDPICEASVPVSLTATPAGGIWTGHGVTPGGVFDPSIAGLGIHDLQYQIADGACAYAENIEVEVLQGQDVNTANVLAFCENEAVATLEFSPTGGQWSGPGISDPSLGLFDPTISGAGSFTLAYELMDNNGCLVTKETQVEVQALPTVSAPDTSIFCVDALTIVLAEELTPTALPTGGVFNWESDHINDTNSGVFNNPGEGTHPVQLYYSFELCTVETAIQIDISSPGDVIAGVDQTACINESNVILTGFPAGGRWSGPGILDAFTGEVDLNLSGSGEHEYHYTLANDSNCELTDTLLLNIQGPGELDAGLDLAFCQGEGQQALPAAVPAGGQWSGPGVLDINEGLINIDQLASDATFWYQYSITDAETACTFSDSVAVRVNPIPDMALELPDHICAGEQIELEVASQDGTTYSWILNEEETFDGESIQFNLTESGTYPIQLSALNAEGCEYIINENLTVSTLPEPPYSLDAYEGCGPLTIDITNNSSTADEVYEWTFGNGETSTAADPAATTFLPAVFDTTYQIDLRVSNLCGSATYTEMVNVLARPVADFGTPVDSGCGQLEISFANATTGSADTYFWDFGNGETSEDLIPINQTYTTTDTSATTYDITLIATNLCGSDSAQHSIVVEPANITPFFNVSDTQGCEPLTVEFADYSNYGANISWDFGDGTTTTEADPVHIFDQPGYYTVYQYVNTACGTDSAMVNIEVLPAPSAMFEHEPLICPDESVVFENQSSEFITVFWDFGDGTYSTEVTPEHSYQEPGTYPVTMVITNADFMCQSVHNSSVNILDRPDGGILTEGDSACPPLDICFDAEYEGASFFEWSFGDQNTSTELNPCHSFTEPGRYTVNFRVADENGCFSAYDSINVRVFDQPIADIAVPKDVYCGNTQTISFVNNSTNGATNYQWTFSNGTSSNLSEPTMTFNGTGSYTAELLASNTFNCQDRALANFTIAPQPMADFAPILNDGCVPETVTFDNASVNVTDYLWDFGNGETTSEVHPSIIYRDPGSYSVNLLVSYDNLCFDSLELDGSINLFTKPTAAFSWDIPTDTYRGIVQFTNESENANSYLWNFGDGLSSEAVHPLHDHGRNGDWETELIAMDLNGCTDTAFVNVTPDFMYDLFFPNALSPESGEGDVRVFKPAGIGLEAWTLEIFSPWGQRIFLSEELSEDQPAASWDGRYKDEMLPQGAYAYKAKVMFLNGIQRVYTGSVTLLR